MCLCMKNEKPAVIVDVAEDETDDDDRGCSAWVCFFYAFIIEIIFIIQVLAVSIREYTDVITTKRKYGYIFRFRLILFLFFSSTSSFKLNEKIFFSNKSLEIRLPWVFKLNSQYPLIYIYTKGVCVFTSPANSPITIRLASGLPFR